MTSLAIQRDHVVPHGVQAGQGVRILHCIEAIASGGVEQCRLSLVRALRPPSYRHHIICSSANGPVADALSNEGVGLTEVGAVGSVFSPARYRAAARVVDQWAPDIIHGAVIEGYTVASLVGRWKRVPVVIMEETSDPQTRRWKGHLLARVTAGLADHCVAVSPGVGRYLTATLGVPRSMVSVINNGVEQPDTPPAARIRALKQRYRLAESDLVVGSVGRILDDPKRFSDLIRAVALLPPTPFVKLLIVGGGPDLPMLRELARELGVANRVIFTGFQHPVGHFYALMDIFALASEREAFGLVNAEAMRCGLPLVATRVGGIPDVVVDKETGFLVGPRDVSAMAAALRRLVVDPHLRARMGAAGKVRADREFSAERYVADVRALYDNLSRRGS